MKRNWVLPLAFMLVFALSRIPGMLPPGFTAAYAVFFCAGVYFCGRTAWWLPLSVMLVTDVGLDLYYHYYLAWDVFNRTALGYQLVGYVVYVLLICLGRRFKPQARFLALLGGGILGALIFYVVTNTASWFFNPFGNPDIHQNVQRLVDRPNDGDAWLAGGVAVFPQYTPKRRPVHGTVRGRHEAG